MRVYEAVAGSSMPLIASIADDLSPHVRGDPLGIALDAVQTLFHVATPERPYLSDDMLEHNRRIFIKYHTFIEGDNVPPSWNDRDMKSLMARNQQVPNREAIAKKQELCIKFYRKGFNDVREGLGQYLLSSKFNATKVSKKPLLLSLGQDPTSTSSLAQILEKFGKRVLHCCSTPAVTNTLTPDYMPALWERSMPTGLGPRSTLGKINYTNIREDVDAIFDQPVAEVFLYLLKSFPNAKVILTIQNSSAWADSCIRHHNASTIIPKQSHCGLLGGYLASRFSFNRKELETLYDMQSDLVRCLVPNDNLLELNPIEMSLLGQEELIPRVAKLLGISDAKEDYFKLASQSAEWAKHA